MNSWLILLLLLFGNQNGCSNNGDSDCGYDSDRMQGGYRSSERSWDGDRNGNFEREYGRGRNLDNNFDGDDDDDSCGCNNNNNNNESRFEPRFDSRPFNNSDCGCDNQ